MNNEHWLERTQLLLGDEKLAMLQEKNILIVGLGGVGAFVAESLVRSGIQNFTIIDADQIRASNINRQLLATRQTEGQNKTDLMKERMLSINPNVNVTAIQTFLNGEFAQQLLTNNQFDYVVDAIDTLMPKAFLIAECIKKNIPIVSSLGAGGKLDPTKIQIADISKTHHCKLGRMLRKRLSKFGIKSGFQTIFSPEEVDKKTVLEVKDERNKNNTVGTISYMPAIFGMFAASVVINDIINKDNNH